MSKSHPRWRLAKKILTWVFFIAVAVLLVVYAQKVDWEEVWKVIRNYNRMVLLGATGLVIVSYLMYGCYDLLGRAYCGHKLAKRQVMLVSFICYAFNLTLSTWVGGIGMRYRLYSRLGLPGGTITRIFSLSITTNWLGYILLGGVIFTIGVVQLPAHWYIGHRTAADYRRLSLGLRVCKAPPYDHQRAKAGPALVEVCGAADGGFQRQLDGDGSHHLAADRRGRQLLLRAGRAAGEQYCRGDCAYSGGDRRAGGGVYCPAGRRACFSGNDYRRPAGVPHAVLLPAAGAGNDLLSGAGKSGEKAAGEE